MPTLTRWFVRLSLLHLVLALALAALLAGATVLPLPGWLGVLNPVYFHLFMVGWVTNLIFGVAHWMFPRATPERPRGREGLVWATFLLLNGGLLLRALAEPMAARQPGGLWGYLLALSALLQWLGGLAFVVNTWGRVKER